MLRSIKQRTLDKFVRKLNGHWFTIHTRKSNSGRLPHANTIAHKNGKLFNDYCGQNTPLNSFKTWKELEINSTRINQAAKKIKPLYQRVIEKIKNGDIYSVCMLTNGDGLWDFQQIKLHKMGYSITFFTAKGSRERMVEIFKANYPKTTIKK